MRRKNGILIRWLEELYQKKVIPKPSQVLRDREDGQCGWHGPVGGDMRNWAKEISWDCQQQKESKGGSSCKSTENVTKIAKVSS